MDEFERTIIGGTPEGAPQLQLPATLRIFLSFTNGPIKGQKIRLTKTVVTVGRKPPADIVIPDPTVSSAHAIFEIENEVVTIKDRNSTNGTLVGGQKVTESIINNMDEVGFGDSRALLTIVQDTYGLYAEEEGEYGEEQTDLKASPAEGETPKAQPYEHCLVAGYNAAQMGALRGLVEDKMLAKISSPALNGGEFLQEAGKSFREQNPIDIIITEIKMPILNGLLASVAFRAFEKGFGTKTPAPIVLFTEMPPDTQIQKAVEYLKPCKYLQTTPDRAEFERRATALIQRLVELGQKRKKE